ncbi:hypothetical protein [Pontibacter sp. G13]|uniref:hypothetical protein n=1 Tax=Pontibacter sp. G13 TaxID=3074898 RepID=UPI00288B545C|nr:hypothetical protein [Pontibacter sp. G13]WNJ20682.1 hypothetical protein RJD25_09390 [Pontibacter sp. G13]
MENKVKVIANQPQLRMQVVNALMSKGTVQAIRVYMEQTGSRLKDARASVRRIAEDIEPGQATGQPSGNTEGQPKPAG